MSLLTNHSNHREIKSGRRKQGQSDLEALERRALLSALFSASFTGTLTDLPYSVAVADLNGDGKQDIITANKNSTVSYLLGNGDGTFQPPVTIADGLAAGQTSVAVASLKNNGKEDIIASSDGGSQVSVLIRKANGEFKPPELLSTGAGGVVDSLAVSNLAGGDAAPDIVTGDHNGAVSVFLANGNGTFQAPQTMHVCNGGVNLIAVADINKDGIPDLVVANNTYDTVSVFDGVGDGTFEAAGSPYTVGTAPDCIAVGDVTGDGNVDIVVGGANAQLSVLLGNGGGTFAAPMIETGPVGLNSVAIADFNGDGKGDLVVGAASATYGYTQVLLSNGDGNFQSVASYQTTGYYADTAAVGDFNGDGKPDIVYTDLTNMAVDVLLDKTFATLVNGTVNVVGTNGADAVSLASANGNLLVVVDSSNTSFPLSSVNAIDVNLLAGRDSLAIGPGVPAVIANGGPGADTIVAGNSTADTINGNGGNDSIVSNVDNSKLIGGAGNDTVVGSGAAQTLNGGAGSDSLVGGGDGDVLNAGTGNSTLVAGSGNETLNGNVGNDSIQGGPGNDLLLGGAGADTLVAGTGNNTLRGNGGDDSLDGSGGGNDLLSGGGGNDTLVGAITGDGIDTLLGGAGNDSINGGPNDSLYGGGQNDTVVGGA